MKVVAVDDEKLMLDRIKLCIENAEPQAEIFLFDNAKEALDFASREDADVFFLDVKMPGMDGVTLAKEIKLLRPRTNIIFSTGYSDYMPDAFLLNVSGYLLKPITTKQVKEQLEILRFPVNDTDSSKVKIQCFGNYEAFVKGKPIKFKHGKTKEILAYLTLRRGAVCTNNEIISMLWEDDGSHSSYFRDLKKDMSDTLAELGYKKLVDIGRGTMSLRTEYTECDYYQWCDGIASGINAYHGEFMCQYSWAEFINMSILEKK